MKNKFRKNEWQKRDFTKKNKKTWDKKHLEKNWQIEKETLKDKRREKGDKIKDFINRETNKRF